MENKETKKKYKRRFGDRPDGRRVRTLPPMARVSPYIMKTRNTSTNYFQSEINMDKIDQYIKEKKAQGLQGFSIMHVLIASYIRTVSQLPAINRFIAGQKIFARHKIEVCMVIKKEMSLESPDTALKFEFTPDATADEVYHTMTKTIEEYRNSPGGGFDDTAKVLSFIPGLVMRGAVGLLHMLDYFGILPQFLCKISPFHGSFFITSMGSLGIPPIYHHLYDFGNVPLFMAFGAKEHRNELEDEGSVKKVCYVGYTMVMDERIVDGYYYASACKYMQRLYKKPWVLDEKPETVVEDIP